MDHGVKSDLDYEHKPHHMDPTHPVHPMHPAHPDNHHHRSHHPHADYIRKILAIYIVVTIFLLFGMGALTNAPFGSVMLAFSPSLLLGIFGLALLTTDHFDVKYMTVLMIVLLVLLGTFLSSSISGMDMQAVIGINLIMGAVLLLVLSHSHHDTNKVVVETDVENESVENMVATIQDKCKAMNFVIGRVYSVHHGASASMRNMLKVDPDWYNEFDELKDKPEENKNLMIGVLEKIKRRLEESNRPENKVFTTEQLGKLKNLDRDSEGGDKIIDVLDKNDGDPAEQYHRGAIQYCDIALEKLEEL